MAGKKVFLLAVSFVIMGLLANSAFAQDSNGIGGVLETIRNLFDSIPETLNLNNLAAGNEGALFWAKFLIWIILFAVVYFGATFVFKDNKRVAVVVAIAISLMGALLIPNDAVINIFKTYGLAAGFVVWFIPVVAGLWIAHLIKQPIAKAAFYLVLIILLLSIDKTLSSLTDFGQWGDYFRLLLVAVIIAFIWNLFSAFGGNGAGEGARGWFGDRGRDLGDWISGGRRDHDDGHEPEGRKEKAKEREDLREQERLQELDRKIDNAQERLEKAMEIPENDEIARLKEIGKLVVDLEGLKNQSAQLKSKEMAEKYDQIVQDMIERLKRVANDLKEVKVKEKRERRELVRGTYYSKLRLIVQTKKDSKLNFKKKEHLNRQLEERWRSDTPGGMLGDHYFDKIKPLEKEIQDLVREKIIIDRNDYTTFLRDQQRLDRDIQKISSLLKYIQENAGNKKNRRNLNTKAMYDAIKTVYTDGINSRRELEITERHQELKRKIEDKAHQILSELNNLINQGS